MFEEDEDVVAAVTGKPLRSIEDIVKVISKEMTKILFIFIALISLA
jgi:hypothetical protein